MTKRVRGFDMAFDDTGGTKTPLVLVHGFPLDRSVWSAQATGLAGVARVIAPDLRGFGGSALPDGAVTMDTYAADVAALLDALGVERAVIGGVSMGGYIAFAFRRLYPARVRALLLVDTRPGADSAEGKKARDEMAALARSNGAAGVSAKMLPKMLGSRATPAVRASLSKLMERQSVPGVVAALGAMRDREDSTPDLARISVPTLVVSGDEDALIPPKESEAMNKAIAGSRLALVPGAGHLPNFEQPLAFDTAVRDWLATVT
jgi:pimeloyl-ACP methyl ester carboxylesterase